MLVEGNYEISPWIPYDLADGCGVLWVGGPEDPVPYDLDQQWIGKELWWGVERGVATPEACR